MEAIIYRVKHKNRSDIFKLYPLGDIHGGTIYCVETKIKKQVKAIEEDPLALWIGMGDYADLIIRSDKRFDDHIISDWVRKSNIPEDQCKWVEKLFEPIKDKCIGLLEGNHEASIRREHSYDFILNLCERLNVRHLGYSCFVKLIFQWVYKTNTGTGAHAFIGHFTHGSGAPQTEGGKVMNLKKSLDDFESDIYATGHIHDIKVIEKPCLAINNADPPVIIDKNRCGAITGCWFKTYMQGNRPSYAEMKRYSPTPIGCPVFTIYPTKGLVNVFSNANMMLKRLSEIEDAKD